MVRGFGIIRNTNGGFVQKNIRAKPKTVVVPENSYMKENQSSSQPSVMVTDSPASGKATPLSLRIGSLNGALTEVKINT